MKRIINHRDFNSFTLEKVNWDIEYHNHNFYEIIVIEEGIGKQRLNDITFKYKKGDVFFLKPNDAHEFIINKKTKFLFIKFTKQFISELNLGAGDVVQKLNIDDLLIWDSYTANSVINDAEDKIHFTHLSKMIFYEFVNHKNGSSEIIFQVFISLLLLLKRNLLQQAKLKHLVLDNKIEQILSFLSLNVFDSEKVSISAMAIEFSMSKNYISNYVKSKTGLSIQKHIINHY